MGRIISSIVITKPEQLLQVEVGPISIIMGVSSPLVMCHFVVEFLALVVSCSMTDGAGYDCTVSARC